MKILKKTVALAISTVMIGTSLSGCVQATVFGKYPKDYSWAYKDSVSTMSIGTYIYYNMESFYNASSKVKNGEGDFLAQKLKDDDDKEMTAKEFITKTTDQSCKQYLYVNKTFKDLKLTLTDEEISSYKATADQYWVSYYKTACETMGISKESFTETQAIRMKLDKIFRATYQKGGKKEVKADELKKYYEENYVNYNYISLPLYDEVTDEEAESTTEDGHEHKKKSDKDIKAIKTNFDKYVKAINGGTSYDDEVKVYMKDYKVDSDPTISATNQLENSGLGEELQKAFKEMKDKQAKYIVVGEDGDAPMIYLLYRGDIKEESKKLADNEDLSTSVLYQMKDKEFEEDVKKAVKDYQCEINTEAVDKYPMTMFITEPATETATQTATADEIADGDVEADVGVVSENG